MISGTDGALVSQAATEFVPQAQGLERDVLRLAFPCSSKSSECAEILQ
jgi:hypothetical protein